jgi:hypothetical protein
MTTGILRMPRFAPALLSARRVVRATILASSLSVVAGLAGCATSGPQTSADSGAAVTAEANSTTGFFGPKNPYKGVTVVREDNTYDPSLFVRQGYCPPVQVRAGTESFVSYERKHEDDPLYIRYQGAISDTARECQGGIDQLTVKIGIAGRIVGGPKVKAGPVAMPLRVAVVKQHGGTVVYSKAFKLSGSLAAPAFSSDFRQVVDNVTFPVGPDDRDLIIYVGFDEGPPKKPATG